MEAIRRADLEQYEIISPTLEFRSNQLRLLEEPNKDELANLEPEIAIADIPTTAVEFHKTYGEDPDSARMYLQEIGQHKLLTPKEEISLAQEMEAGSSARKTLAELETTGKLDSKRKLALENRVRLGAEAKNKLITCNLRLVVSVAKKRGFIGKGLSLPDLIQEGNIGLMIGVEKYKWRKGYRLSTYVYWWIRQAQGRALSEQGRTIRVPVHMVEYISKLARAQRELEVELDREPTSQELGQFLDISADKVDEIRRAARSISSLDIPISIDRETTMGDLVADNNAQEAISGNAEQSEMKEELNKALDSLKSRERQILWRRFGLEDDRPRTLEEVSKEFGVTRERIRQIEAEALRKLRRPHRSKKLRDYLSD